MDLVLQLSYTILDFGRCEQLLQYKFFVTPNPDTEWLKNPKGLPGGSKMATKILKQFHL